VNKYHKIIATFCISIISLQAFASGFIPTIQPTASLTVYCGSMCSGKSEEAIRVISRLSIARSNIGAFKLKLDDRVLAANEKDPLRFITSRNGGSVACTAVENVEEMAMIIATNNHTIIAIDEAQFFHKESIIAFVRSMLAANKKIIIFGLDLDFKGETFGAMGELCAQADEVIKLKAVCSLCKSDTHCITQRLVDGQPAHYNDPIIMVGDIGYEPRCRNCHIIRKD